MIRTEQIMIKNTPFTRTWSDARRYVVREGIKYEEAYDPTEFGRTYIEGNLIPIEEEWGGEEIG